MNVDTLKHFQALGIELKELLQLKATEYDTFIRKKCRAALLKNHPHKNNGKATKVSIKSIQRAKQHLLKNSFSITDLIYWYLDNQTNIHTSDSSAEQPKFTSSSAFSWFSIRGFIRALDRLICNLFYIVSGIALFMAQGITAFIMLDQYQFLLYIAVVVIVSSIMTELLGLTNTGENNDKQYELSDWQKYLRCISRNIPSITITAAMILYGLAQHIVSIKVFLLSMSTLSLFFISILLILLMVDFGMKDYPSLINFKESTSIILATVLVAMALVSNSFLFCVSMDVLFFYTYHGCKVVSESRFLAYAFTWCFPPDLEFEKSHSALDPSNIKGSFQSSNQPLKAITSGQVETITNNTQNQSTHQR
ncbi:hypothetical protein N9Y17_00455 [Gammaproteobacteria bacterium]|nr:hypothetical protein [Gammaproteobacteria bacterium]